MFLLGFQRQPRMLRFQRSQPRTGQNRHPERNRGHQRLGCCGDQALRVKTTPDVELDGRAKPSYSKVSVPRVRVALVTECLLEVKMKGDEDMVKVREAVAGTIDKPEEAATNS